MKQWKLMLILGILVVLAACAPTAAEPVAQPSTATPTATVTAVDAPTATPQPTPSTAVAPTTAPSVASLVIPDTLETTTWDSPHNDGWVVISETSPSVSAADGASYYFARLTAANQLDGRHWVVTEGWLPWGMGYVTPVFFQWSRDAQSFYYTNIPHIDGCAWGANGSDLHRFNLETGVDEMLLENSTMRLALAPAEYQLAYTSFDGLVIRNLLDGQETLYNYDANQTIGPLAWYEDNQQLAVLLNGSPCGNGPVTVLVIDVVTGAMNPIALQGNNAFNSVVWLTADALALTDGTGATWRLELATGVLMQASDMGTAGVPAGVQTTSNIFTPFAPSPSGRYVVEQDWSTRQTFLRDLQTDTATLLPHNAYNIQFQNWISDNQILVGVWLSADEEGPNLGHLALYDVPSQTLTVLDDQAGSYAPPAASPDGRTIAYDLTGEPWLYDLQTGTAARFPAETYTGWPSLNSPSFASPAWSPDGRYLAFLVGGQEVLPNDWGRATAVFDLQAQTVQLLNAYSPAGMGGWPPAPVWSADSQWLAVQQWATDQQQGGIWVLGLQGGLYHLGASTQWGAWAPTGQAFIYNRYISSNNVDFTVENYLAEFPGATPTLLNMPPTEKVIGWH